MKPYFDDQEPDLEASGMPRDMRDSRSLWQRIKGIFKGYKVFPWYW